MEHVACIRGHGFDCLLFKAAADCVIEPTGRVAQVRCCDVCTADCALGASSSSETMDTQILHNFGSPRDIGALLSCCQWETIVWA
eukprot:1932182-Amphidinium_carterae.1